MSTEEDVELSSLQSNLSQTHIKFNHEIERGQTQMDILQEKLMEVKACIHGSEKDSGKELEVLWQRVKTIATLLNSLKCRARIMSDPPLISSGIKPLEGFGLVDENDDRHDSVDREEDTIDFGEILKAVQMVTNVMEVLVKRVIIAESETAIEKEKVTLGQEEVKRKTSQIESMNLRLDEMERFAVGTNTILSDMKQRVEDLVEETCRQRQRATDNEHELCRVKQDFESLKSYVSSLISVRETLLSSEKQFQTIERLFERLVEKTNQLEGEKMQKDVEVLKLMEENVKLSDLLDKKEAQLVAMNEQCKVMALSSSHI